MSDYQPTDPAREQLARDIFIADNAKALDPPHEWDMTTRHNPANSEYAYSIADGLIAAGYRQIFDGDCGLSGIQAPDDRQAAEAWMRFANLINADGGEPNGIAAMKQMLTELGYRKPATVTTTEELEALPLGSVVLDSYGTNGDVYRIGATLEETGLRRVYNQAGPQGRFRAIALPAAVLHYGAGR